MLNPRSTPREREQPDKEGVRDDKDRRHQAEPEEGGAGTQDEDLARPFRQERSGDLHAAQRPRVRRLEQSDLGEGEPKVEGDQREEDIEGVGAPVVKQMDATAERKGLEPAWTGRETSSREGE